MLESANRGIILLRDELSEFVGNLGAYKKRSNDAAKFLEWFNGQVSKIDRKTQDPVFIPRAAVWIAGTIQPNIFWQCSPDAYAENGFLARFLIAYPPRQSQGWSDEVIADPTRENWNRTVQRLRSLQFQIVPDKRIDFSERVEPIAIPRRRQPLSIEPQLSLRIVQKSDRRCTL